MGVVVSAGWSGMTPIVPATGTSTASETSVQDAPMTMSSIVDPIRVVWRIMSPSPGSRVAHTSEPLVSPEAGNCR